MSFLLSMLERGKAVVDEVSDNARAAAAPILTIRYGYYPSSTHGKAAMHFISYDFDSPFLNHKRNSFAIFFLMHLCDWCSKRQGRVDLDVKGQYQLMPSFP